MKITKLEIVDYQQFKDFTLDLTYPAGHELAGKPLKKVCFIGQSGTGKTTILDLISHLILSKINSSDQKNDSFALAELYIQNDFGKAKICKTWEKKSDHHQTLGHFYNSQIRSDNQEDIKYFLDHLNSKNDEKQMPILVSFPVGISNYVLDSENNNDSIFTKNSSLFIDSSKYVVFDDQQAQNIWNEINQHILVYQTNEANFRLELSQKAEKNENVNIKNAMNVWRKGNINPLIEIAEKCLDPLLNLFALRVKKEIDDVNATKFIRIEDFKGQTIPFQKLSTGTKQVFFTAFPLFQLVYKKYESGKEMPIILFDEPENSLYPDVQRTLIDYYTQLAPDAQFFFATHSPLIASQFEPCERFILSFDENGKVQFRNGYAPEGDDPNDLLHKDFGLENILSGKGLQALERFILLKSLIKQENDLKIKDELIKEYLTLQRNYNF